jgi:hypothetical protein
MLDTYRHILTYAGSDRWFSEFKPVHTDIDVFYGVLSDLNKRGFCCSLTGTYVCYLASIVNQSVSAAMFFVMTDCPAVRFLFQSDMPAPLSF